MLLISPLSHRKGKAMHILDCKYDAKVYLATKDMSSLKLEFLGYKTNYIQGKDCNAGIDSYGSTLKHKKP